MIAPKKKRKLETSSNTAPLSAVAARRAKDEAKLQSESAQENRDSRQIEPSIINIASLTSPSTISKRSQPATLINTITLDQISPKENGTRKGDLLASLSIESRAESPKLSPERTSVVLSTLQPSKEANNFKELKNGGLLIRLAPGERLVILGQYEMTILQGEITFLGAAISASDTAHPIYAPSCHALPVIRCLGTEVGYAEIVLRQHKSGLEHLDTLSPLFAKIWNDGKCLFGSKFDSLLKQKRSSTYQILFSTEENTQKSFLQPLLSPPQWNAMLASLVDVESGTNSVTMLCGPKSSGKSTFTKLLSNKLLLSSRKARSTGVAILDLDPGQPEYSLPGQLSLIHLREPNFGPPFSHPQTTERSNTVRSHAIAAVSPAMDPNLYTACVLDLFAHYRILISQFPKCPLIINTPGWVLGTGLEILIELINRISPSQIIYMSEDGPQEVVDSLKEAAGSTPLYTLPSQASEYMTRTAAHLRTMQYMSYFHMNTSVKKGLPWNNTPLTSRPPWEIHYSGENAGLLGVVCYGEQPSANLLAETINGTLVSVVVIEDMCAIPGWKSKEEDIPKVQRKGKAVDESFVPFEEGNGIGVFDVDELHPLSPTEPLIIRTPNEKLPYFNPENAISLDPRFSQAIGLALIRGIDGLRRKLQVLTSIDPGVIQQINEQGKKIVLISGKLDTPGWAYTEELVHRQTASKQRRGEKGSNDEEDDSEESADESSDVYDSFANTPWVETLEGSQGRGVGSRVWRVRRDLGKNADTIT